MTTSKNPTGFNSGSVKMETKIIAGKHKCGQDMDLRITDIKKNEKDNKVLAWFVYGICNKCKVVIVLDMFTQQNEPVQDMDYIIDYDVVSEEVKLL